MNRIKFHAKMKFVALAALLVIASVYTISQPATAEQRQGVETQLGMGTLHFQTNLGSFRLIDGEGRVEFTFRGTVLFSGIDGEYTITGNTRKEYEDEVRTVYSGEGRVVVTGKWRAVQWFGRDLDGVWFGRGLIRIWGEFDRDGNTGTYWYDDPTNPRFWPATAVNTIELPEPRLGVDPSVQPERRR